MPAPNGLRYPLVGGTGERRFTGINFKPRKVLENAQTPTSRVHAVLARLLRLGERALKMYRIIIGRDYFELKDVFVSRVPIFLGKPVLAHQPPRIEQEQSTNR